MVNIDQAEYTDRFGEEAGVRVVLHPQDKMPFPEDDGVLARPGMLTSVGVRKVLLTLSNIYKCIFFLFIIVIHFLWNLLIYDVSYDSP